MIFSHITKMLRWRILLLGSIRCREMIASIGKSAAENLLPSKRKARTTGPRFSFR